MPALSNINSHSKLNTQYELNHVVLIPLSINPRSCDLIIPSYPFPVQYPFYNLALLCCARLSIGSIFVAFIIAPLIFSFPDMNIFCAFALPSIIFWKSASDSINVTAIPTKTLY